MLGNWPGLHEAAALRQADPAKQPEQVELGFAFHLFQGFVVGKIVDPDDHAFAQRPKGLGQALIGRMGKSFEIRQGRRLQVRKFVHDAAASEQVKL